MKKSIFFYGPPHMDLYKDICQEMETMGYEVDYMEEMKFPEDPYNLRGKTNKLPNRDSLLSDFYNKIKETWKNLLETTYTKKYDYFFVLDGQSIHPCVFQILRERNPHIKCVNYLFDTSKIVYEFYHNYKYYDSVFSFDPEECKTYNVSYSPIYWLKNCSNQNIEKFDLFGMGWCLRSRYQLFKYLKDFSQKNHLKSYLKLYVPSRPKSAMRYRLRYIKNYIMGKKESYPPAFLHSEMLTTESMPPSVFRNYIFNSKIVVDTCAEGQIGMTARFMWALGAEKRIITNNQNVKNCSFYTPEQIYIIDSNCVDKKDLEKFLLADFDMSKSVRDIVQDYRIDNWLKTLLS